MPVSELLMEGVTLMLLGMSIVIVFLVVLVFGLLGMSKLAAILEAKHGPSTAPGATGAAAAAPPQADDGELIAVIGAAIARYRGTKR